jgi:hypothetical protein
MQEREGQYSRSLPMLLLDPAELFLDIHALHLRHASGIFGWIGLAVIRQCCSLSPRFFFWRYVQARSTVIDILTLAGKALEVVCNVGGVDRGRVSRFGFITLLLPAGIE